MGLFKQNVFKLIEKNKNEKLIALLKNNKIDIDVKNKVDQTPLDVAIENKNFQIADYLIESGIKDTSNTIKKLLEILDQNSYPSKKDFKLIKYVIILLSKIGNDIIIEPLLRYIVNASDYFSKDQGRLLSQETIKTLYKINPELYLKKLIEVNAEKEFNIVYLYELLAVSDKGLLFKVFKECLLSNNKIQDNSLELIGTIIYQNYGDNFINDIRTYSPEIYKILKPLFKDKSIKKNLINKLILHNENLSGTYYLFDNVKREYNHIYLIRFLSETVDEIVVDLFIQELKSLKRLEVRPILILELILGLGKLKSNKANNYLMELIIDETYMEESSSIIKALEYSGFTFDNNYQRSVKAFAERDWINVKGKKMLTPLIYYQKNMTFDSEESVKTYLLSLKKILQKNINSVSLDVLKLLSRTNDLKLIHTSYNTGRDGEIDSIDKMEQKISFAEISKMATVEINKRKLKK